MSLLERIAEADERGLAASALACLERCLPPNADGGDSEPLRPLWASCEDGREWAVRLTAARASDQDGADETGSPVPEMLRAAPSDWADGPLREWALTCSLLSLEFHRRFDMPVGGDVGEDAAEQAGEQHRPTATGQCQRDRHIPEADARPAVDDDGDE